MSKVIDIKTGKAVPPVPATRARKLPYLVARKADLRFSRDECCVTLVRITAACEELLLPNNAFFPTVTAFAAAALAEIDNLMHKLETTR